MEIRVLSPSFVAIDVIDTVESILINERYDEPGDFEFYSKYTPDLDALLQKDRYVKFENSDELMIIESKELKNDPENGNKIIVKGRSFSSALDRRIILKQIIIDGSLQAGVHAILNQNVVASQFAQRNFPNFTLATSSDVQITSLILSAQFYTENVLDVIMAICRQHAIGFKVTINSSNVLVFSLYAGSNRSYGQLSNPFVVFSPGFDNIISSNYFESKREKKNWAFIAGDEGLANWNQGYYGRWAQVATFDYDGGTGLALREVFIDASSLATVDYNTSSELTAEQYVEQLEQLGYQELYKLVETSSFSAEIDITKQYRYKQDFYLGDIVQYIDEYGHTTAARIVEISTFENINGHNIYPTLRSL